MLGPKCVAFGEALVPNIGLRRHVRSRPEPPTLNRTRDGCLASAWHPLPSRAHGRRNALLARLPSRYHRLSTPCQNLPGIQPHTADGCPTFTVFDLRSFQRSSGSFGGRAVGSAVERFEPIHLHPVKTHVPISDRRVTTVKWEWWLELIE
jgi:hypothetical protein